jgi:hypothetical protein
MHRKIAIPLKVFNGRLARAQRSDFPLQIRDVLDFRFEFGDLGLQKRVPCLLIGNLPLVPGEDSTANHTAQQRGQTQLGKELVFLPLAGCLSVRQQVDQDHW